MAFLRVGRNLRRDLAGEVGHKGVLWGDIYCRLPLFLLVSFYKARKCSPTNVSAMTFCFSTAEQSQVTMGWNIGSHQPIGILPTSGIFPQIRTVWLNDRGAICISWWKTTADLKSILFLGSCYLLISFCDPGLQPPASDPSQPCTHEGVNGQSAVFCYAGWARLLNRLCVLWAVSLSSMCRMGWEPIITREHLYSETHTLLMM